MKKIYKDWSGYSFGIFAFIILGYFIMMLPSTKSTIFYTSIFLIISGIMSLFIVMKGIAIADFSVHALKSFGLTSTAIGAMCFLGYLTK